MTTRFDTHCPHCGKRNDMHDNMLNTEAVPADGDVSLCIGCGKWAIYEGQALRFPTSEEMADIRMNPDCQRYQLALVLTRMKQGQNGA